MSASITLASDSTPAQYRFPLDRETPPDVLAFEPSLTWQATVSDISGVPARFAHTTLSSGVKLAEMPARVSFSIGTASSTGRALYGDEAVWGHLLLTEADSVLMLGMHVSERIFSRLVRLAEFGVLPAVTAELRDSPDLHTSIVDGRLDAWRSDSSPHLVVEWCGFTADLPQNGSRRDVGPGSNGAPV